MVTRFSIIRLFPARAGVILGNDMLGEVAITIPRTRGGDPDERSEQAHRGDYSPHARG